MKRKKVLRQRGHKTHGWGSKKKHRGAGNRGGRGNAGSGKRADQKKPSYWAGRKPRKGQKLGQAYFGKVGFGMVSADKAPSITIKTLQSKLPVWVEEKKATYSKGEYAADLTSLGYGKLLGTGKAVKKMSLKVLEASAGAIEKVASVGGKVELASAGRRAPVEAEAKEDQVQSAA